MQFERKRRGPGDINITPLIDMVFLLLIFFLLTSSFIVDRGIKINLPKAVSSETAHDKRITVAIDSSGDVFVDLDVRADIANRNNADLFISVHVNSIPRGKAVGTETWVMGIAKNPGNLELVKKENEVIMLEDDYSSKYEGYDPENPGSLIGFSVMQNIYQSQSLNMASYVQDQFRTRAKRKDRGVKAGQLLVLWKTTMPSVLVETGFLSDSNEEAFLMTDYGQDLIASAVYRAFRKYKEEIDERTTRELQVNAEEEQRTQQRINRITEPETKTNRETE